MHKQPAVKNRAEREEKPAEAAAEKPAASREAGRGREAGGGDGKAGRGRRSRGSGERQARAGEAGGDKRRARRRGIKVPSWMKQKQAPAESGDDKAATPPASDAPAP